METLPGTLETIVEDLPEAVREKSDGYVLGVMVGTSIGAAALAAAAAYLGTNAGLAPLGERYESVRIGASFAVAAVAAVTTGATAWAMVKNRYDTR
jgi:hypothetical protein